MTPKLLTLRHGLSLGFRHLHHPIHPSPSDAYTRQGCRYDALNAQRCHCKAFASDRASLRQTGLYNNVTLLTIELASPSFASGLPVSTHHVMVLTQTQPRIVGTPTRTLAIDEFPVCIAARRSCLAAAHEFAARLPPQTMLTEAAEEAWRALAELQVEAREAELSRIAYSVPPLARRR